LVDLLGFLSEPESCLPDDSSSYRFSMILSSSSTVFLFVGLVLTDKFALVDEPTDASRFAVIVVSLADGPDSVRSERRVETGVPTCKLKLSIVRFVPSSRFVKTGARFG
jgi:hypothetical protein